MAIYGVLRLGEICVRVLDIDGARKHYGEYLGLIETGRDDDGKTYYKAWDEHDSHSVVIRPADHCGVDYVAYKVLDDDTLSDRKNVVSGKQVSISVNIGGRRIIKTENENYYQEVI